MHTPETRRNDFLHALEGAVVTARGDSSNIGLLLIDIVNLATINHYHGYQTGDQVLGDTLDYLLGISKLPDTIFRIGDHRFAFILPALDNPAFIGLAVNRVERTLQDKFHDGARPIRVDVKIGVAINRCGEIDPLATLAHAESSMALVKSGRTLHLEELLEGDGGRAAHYQLEGEFTDALYNNDFELYYQPKIDLTSGQVTSAEALMRWHPEGREPVSPELTVELADSTGQSFRLAKWLVHVALRQLGSWRHTMDMGVAVNIQADLVGNPDLPELFQGAIAIWGTDPARITVEITESALIEDMESGFENLTRLKELGVKLSIDDFGTGYSSLSYFKYIPADELKIDRSFVSRMMVDHQDMELVKIMIHIAHQFGLKVVAEGVEDRASLDMLRELGCDYAQGYYLSRPMPGQAFEDWMSSWSGLPAPA